MSPSGLFDRDNPEVPPDFSPVFSPTAFELSTTVWSVESGEEIWMVGTLSSVGINSGPGVVVGSLGDNPSSGSGF